MFTGNCFDVIYDNKLVTFKPFFLNLIFIYFMMTKVVFCSLKDVFFLNYLINELFTSMYTIEER